MLSLSTFISNYKSKKEGIREKGVFHSRVYSFGDIQQVRELMRNELILELSDQAFEKGMPRAELFDLLVHNSKQIQKELREEEKRRNNARRLELLAPRKVRVA